MHLCWHVITLIMYIVGAIETAGKGSSPDIPTADADNGDRTL